MSSARVVCRCCRRLAVFTDGGWRLASVALTSPWLSRWTPDHLVVPVRAPRRRRA